MKEETKTRKSTFKNGELNNIILVKFLTMEHPKKATTSWH